MHCALERSNVDAQVVRAFDWDQLACRVYDANYGKGIVRKVFKILFFNDITLCLSRQTDISTLDAFELRDLDASLWLLSPSCQPYTVLNPGAKGAEDPRARSFLHLIEHVLPDLAKQGCAPRWMLIENVAGFEVCIAKCFSVDLPINCHRHRPLEKPSYFNWRASTILWRRSYLHLFNSVYRIHDYDITYLPNNDP